MSRFLNERLQAFKAYTPGEQPKNVGELIKLNTNESPFPPSPKVVEAVSAHAVERLRLYSDLAATDLISALAQDLGVSKDQIMVGNGSDEVIYFAMLAFGGQGAQFADVTYGFYPVWAQLIGMDARTVPLNEDYQIDPTDYLKNDRMLIIANPNAPTGTVLEMDKLRRIICANPDQIVLVDEAYVDFGGQSAVSWIDEFENLLVVRTFSKSRQMAGARLGFAVGQRALIEDLDKMRYAINPYNVNSLTQLAGAAAVRDRAYFEQCIRQIVDNRDFAAGELTKLGFTVLPSTANFVFASPPDGDGQRYMQALRQRNILVRWFDQPRTTGFVRITIGTRAQMQALIYATRIILEKST